MAEPTVMQVQLLSPEEVVGASSPWRTGDLAPFAGLLWTGTDARPIVPGGLFRRVTERPHAGCL